MQPEVDYDGLEVVRGLMVAIPLSVVMWGLIWVIWACF
jgi:hypothetical protein